MTAPSPPTRKFEAMLVDLLARVDQLERGGRAGQLGNSSLDGQYLTVRDTDGYIRATWGAQPDGTVHTRNVNGPPPPRPNTPIVTEAMAGLVGEWNGEFVGIRPGDFSHVAMHCSPVEGFIAGPSNLVGTFTEAGQLSIGPLEYQRHYVKFIAYNTSGKASEPSFEAFGTPRKVVADEVLAGIINELAIAERAITEAKLEAGAVTSTKIGDNAITSPKIVAGAVRALQLDAGAVTAEKLAALAVTAEKIAALAITTDKLDANAVTAGKIQAGAVTADKIAATLVLASRLIAGNPTGTRVELSGSGMIVVRANGDTTFQVDSATGDVVSMGEYYTSRQGERLAMNVAGLSEPTLRAYPKRGNRYADLRSFTRTVGGTDIANWEFRLPLIGSEAGLVDYMVYDSNFNPIGSSRLRYRPFFNGSGVVHPGWAADGQDSAVVFFGGRVYITNSANNARKELVAGTLTSEGAIGAAGLVEGQTVNARGTLSSGGFAYIGGGLKVGEAYNPVGGQIQSRELTTLGNMSCDGTFYYRAQQQMSDARLKHRFAPIDGSALNAFRDLDWPSWEWLPDPSTAPAPGDPHRHVMATAQSLRDHPLFGFLVHHQASPNDEDTDVLGYDLNSLVGLAGAALHEAGDRIAELETEVGELRDTVADLTARLDRLDAA